MTAKKEYDIVLVVWEDAEEHGDTGWNNMKDQLKYAKKPCPVMKSVGFVVYRDDSHIALMSSLGVGGKDCSTVEKIPMSFVTKVIPLSVTETARDAKPDALKKH